MTEQEQVELDAAIKKVVHTPFVLLTFEELPNSPGEHKVQAFGNMPGDLGAVLLAASGCFRPTNPPGKRPRTKANKGN